MRRSVARGLDSLPDDARKILILRELDGLSYAEIAEEVQRSTKSVDNAVQRIRRKIAQYLSRGEYSES